MICQISNHPNAKRRSILDQDKKAVDNIIDTANTEPLHKSEIKLLDEEKISRRIEEKAIVEPFKIEAEGYNLMQTTLYFGNSDHHIELCDEFGNKNTTREYKNGDGIYFMVDALANKENFNLKIVGSGIGFEAKIYGNADDNITNIITGKKIEITCEDIIEVNLSANKIGELQLCIKTNCNKIADNLSFNIYNENKKLIDTITTDDYGLAESYYYLGVYYYQQSSDNRYADDDTLYEFKLSRDLQRVKCDLEVEEKPPP